MKSITINLSVENCQEALSYYQEIFEGEIKNIQKLIEWKCSKVMKGNINNNIKGKACKWAFLFFEKYGWY